MRLNLNYLYLLLEWIDDDYFNFKPKGDGYSVVDRAFRDWPK